MKIHSLPLVAFLAVLALAVLFPVSVARLCAGLVIAGLAALLVSDYGSAPRPPRAVSPSA
jgi:hypothetical protein